MRLWYLFAAALAAFPRTASAQMVAATAAPGPDWMAIGMFAAIIVATLVITYRSAGLGRSNLKQERLKANDWRTLLRPEERHIPFLLRLSRSRNFWTLPVGVCGSRSEK